MTEDKLNKKLEREYDKLLVKSIVESLTPEEETRCEQL